MPQAVAAAAVWVGQAVGTAIGASLTAVGVGASVALPLAVAGATAAYYVAEIALYTGLSALIDDIATQKAAPMGSELNLRVAADVPRELVIGERVLAGSVVARYSYGSNLYNASFVYQLADHRIEELSQVFGDGRLVRSTPLVHGVRTEITAYSFSGGPRLWMTWHDGRPGQTYDAGLVTKSAQDPDVVAGMIHPWTTAHVGAGCAYVHIEVQWDSDILTSIPEFKFLVKGARLYDRRKDSTAGGLGSHRLDDPSTWEYSKNAAVATDHFLLGYMVEGDPVAFGVGLSPIEVPYAQFAQAANLCDEDVTTGEGGAVSVMKRYEVNGIISAADTFESVITSLQNQMCARIVDLGGRIGIIGAEEKPAPLSFDDDDWASDELVRFADKLGFDSLYGAVIGSYADPGNLFEPTPYDRQATPYLALPDGGEATTAQLDLPYETNSRRAVRLARAWIDRESLQPRVIGVLATRSLAYKLEPGDWFNLSSARWQFTNEKFEVIDVVKHDDFTVTISARAINPNFLAFPVHQDVNLSIPPAIPPATLLLDTPTFTVEAATLVAGDVVEPCLQVTLTSNEEVAREIIVEYGLDDPGVGDTDGDGNVEVLGPTLIDSFHISQVVTNIRKGIMPSTDYRVRIKTRAGMRESPYTAWSAIVTTPAASASGPVDWDDITGANKPADGATRNRVTRSPTAPSSPADGDIWVDTSSTPHVTKTRVSGAWQTTSTVGSIFGVDLYETNGGSLALLNAFKTILGTAAAFTGQGGLSTLNFVTIGTNLRLADGTTVATTGAVVTASGTAAGIAGQGGLATLSFVTIGTNLRLADGTTIATTASVVTASGTAAGFAGQGALATLNSLAYGSGYLTGFAALAALNYVRLGGPTGDRAGLLNEASSAWMTDYLLQTALGIAAGFSGQGGLATGNYYEQSSDPGAVPAGSFWFNTSNSNLYVRRSGSWGHVANIAGGAAQLWGAAYPETGIEGVTYTGYETVYLSGGVSRGGGTGGYTYAWARTGGDAYICSNPGNSQSIAGSIYIGGSGDYWESWICTITDTAGTKVTVSVPVHALKV